MSRGDHKLVKDSFRTWVATVEAAHRVRLPRELGDVVSWLTTEAEAVEIVGTPGPAGGVQVQPLTAHRREVQRLTDALRNISPTDLDAAQRWMNMARLLATAWAMTIAFESGRFSMKLPEPARRMQLLPPAGGTVVIFGFGEVFEIWDGSKWYEHVRTTAARKAAAMSEALEDLEER